MKHDPTTGRILPKLSPDQKAALIADYQSGLTLAAAGAKHGVLPASVFYILSRAGVRKRTHYKLDAAQKDEIVRRYVGGEEIPALTAAFGMDQSSVWALLRRRKVPMRSRSEACRIYDLNETAFDEITEASAYWAGFLMADGCVMVRPSGQHCITLALAETDAGHVATFRVFLGSTNPIRVEDNSGGFANGQRMHCLTVTSKRLAERLMALGVVPRKSGGARVAESLEDDRHFWRGMVDGDGCVRIYVRESGTAAVLGLVGSLPLTEQFSAYVRRHVGCHRVPKRNANVYDVRVHSTYAERLAHLLYDDAAIALPRKAADAQALFDRRVRIETQKNTPCGVAGCRGKRVFRGFCVAHHAMRPPKPLA